MRTISRYDSVSTISHIEKVATFQTLKNKIDELNFPFSLQKVCLLLFQGNMYSLGRK